MKSFCIKNNNKKILDYLLTEIKNINLENIYVSQNSFKLYKNIIVHYKGKDEKSFLTELSTVLMNCIIIFYEKNIVRKIINNDYFYFKTNEKTFIYNNCNEILSDNSNIEFKARKETIFECLVKYISNNKFFILDGFVNFRLFEYRNFLSEVVDVAVNKFIIDKEYKEFIKLLQEYIKTKPTCSNVIHVIYSNFEPILLDENENIIQCDKLNIQAKYLSDISFSSKDYCLNELLNLLPKKIIIHLICEKDDFINTLQLIFKDRIRICKECNICKTFEMLNKSFKSNNVLT